MNINFYPRTLNPLVQIEYNTQISQISNHFQQARVSIVAKQSLQEASNQSFFIQYVVNIKQWGHYSAYNSSFLKLVSAVRHQACCKKDKQNADDAEYFLQ